jgi:hypothetical protein
MASQSVRLNGAELLPLAVKIKGFYRARVKVSAWGGWRPYTKTFSVIFVTRDDALEFAKKQIAHCVERGCIGVL